MAKAGKKREQKIELNSIGFINHSIKQIALTEKNKWFINKGGWNKQMYHIVRISNS